MTSPIEPIFTFVSADFPESPGVYLMKDGTGRIIYVGKAKSLRKRLASYFRSQARHTAKTRALVSHIHSVDVLLTGTEKEALLLEASLIKKHRPRYNIVLRDDKQYLLFRLDLKSEFPRLAITRRLVRDGAIYFGPFTSGSAARQTWKLLGKVFPLRKCSDGVFKNCVRPCLNHDIGQCLGPCVLPVDRELYLGLVKQVELFLLGRTSELVNRLSARMQAHSEALEFEAAALCRDQIRAVERTVERQSVVFQTPKDMDVLALAETGKGLGLGQIFVRQGRLLDESGYFWPGLTLEEGVEVLESFLVQFYASSRFIPPRIVMPYALDDELVAETLAERRGGRVNIGAPGVDSEQRLLDVARKVGVRAGMKREGPDLPELLMRRIGLTRPVQRIECVDISHLSGTDVRAGMVVFEDGRRIKEDSRAYTLPSIEGTSDDYAALAAWAVRRAESGPPWPDLVLIDGGKGQLAAVDRAWSELGEACPPVPLAAIAKGPSRRAGELEDRVFRPGRKNHLSIKPGSPEMLYLQRIRDAAHDFSLGRQRRARKKRVLTSEVLGLPGVGPKTARLLWDHFGSLDAMIEAPAPELAAIPGIGTKKAERIRSALNAMKKAREL
ncbi:MAG: excinuclease ABC subunit UvrC [Proteobacteria bacterium]|nr:excinuclease ABC subunit UvrC [Pseudomonadota bacterium]